MTINTLYELARNSVEKFASKVAFSMFEGDDVTYAEVDRRIAKVQEILTGAGLQAGSRKDFLHLGNTTVHLGVSHVVAFEHRKCDFRRELFHAVASQFVKCIDGHNFSFSTTSE